MRMLMVAPSLLIHVDEGRPLVSWGLSRILLAAGPVEPTGAVIDEALRNSLEQTCRARPFFSLKRCKRFGKLPAKIKMLGPRILFPAEDLADGSWIPLAAKPK